jgi:hypothetical protein
MAMAFDKLLAARQVKAIAAVATAAMCTIRITMIY